MDSKFYSVLKVHKDDLIAGGWDEKKVEKLTDAEMERIAQRIANGLMESYWTAISVINSD